MGRKDGAAGQNGQNQPETALLAKNCHNQLKLGGKSYSRLKLGRNLHCWQKSRHSLLFQMKTRRKQTSLAKLARIYKKVMDPDLIGLEIITAGFGLCI